LFVSAAQYILVAMPVYTKIPLLTIEDYRALPETGPRYQLIEGDLYMAPAPNRFHQDISRNLQFELHSYLKKNPIGKLYDAPFDVYLDEYNVFQPDLIIVLNEHAGILTEAGAIGAPDLIVEILSPKTRRLDLLNKKRVYAIRGVRELWIIDPEPRMVTTHCFSEDGAESVSEIAESGVLTTRLLPGFEISAGLLYEQ
jgi:Uma2 family endonuclease